MLPDVQRLKSPDNRALWLLAALFAIALCSLSGYYRAFSTFAEYDDEGYVMLSLTQHLQGGALFDDVYTQYGPAWYAIQRCLHSVTGLEVTHDITRFKTLFIWLAASGLCSLILWRLSNSRAISLAGFILSFLHLERLTSEPGHPQELCLLAVLGVMAIATNRHGATVRNLMGMAVVTGLAVMTKLNVGLLLVASLTMAMSLVASNQRARVLFTCASVFLIVVGAFVVTRSTFAEHRGLWLPALVACSVLPLAFVGIRQRTTIVSLRKHSLFHMTWVIVACLFCGLTLMQGTAGSSLLHGLVFQHIGFADRFYTAAPIYGFAMPLAAVVAVGTIWLRARDERWHRTLPTILRYVRLASLVLLIGIVQRHFTDLSNPIEHGLDDRAHAGLLMSLLAPLSWLVIVEGSTGTKAQKFSRITLACIAVVQPLIAYPTPGTQMAMGSLPLLLIALLTIHDFIQAEIQRQYTDSGFGTLLNRAVIAAPILLIALSAGYRWQHYERSEPLNLAGATRLRMHPVLAQQTREIVRQIRDNSDTFISLHNGYNSLYLWADVQPPTGLNATFWPWMLSNEQQERVIAALKSRDRICCIEKVIPERSAPPRTPLGDFLSSGFQTQATVGLWQIRILSRN